MASLRAVSIFSLVPRFSLRDIVGSEVISSTREMYDSSCCLASNFLLNASSVLLNLAASMQSLVTDYEDEHGLIALTANHVLNLRR